VEIIKQDLGHDFGPPDRFQPSGIDDYIDWRKWIGIGNRWRWSLPSASDTAFPRARASNSHASARAFWSSPHRQRAEILSLQELAFRRRTYPRGEGAASTYRLEPAGGAVPSGSSGCALADT